MSKDWSNGLFSCCGDFGSCIYVYCCPACAAGEIYEKGELGSCIVGCLLFSCIGMLYPCIFTGPLRAKKGIEGSCMSDTLLCCCCPMCQMTRELREVRGT